MQHKLLNRQDSEVPYIGIKRKQSYKEHSVHSGNHQ